MMAYGSADRSVVSGSGVRDEVYRGAMLWPKMIEIEGIAM